MWNAAFAGLLSVRDLRPSVMTPQVAVWLPHYPHLHHPAQSSLSPLSHLPDDLSGTLWNSSKHLGPWLMQPALSNHLSNIGIKVRKARDRENSCEGLKETPLICSWLNAPLGCDHGDMAAMYITSKVLIYHPSIFSLADYQASGNSLPQCGNVHVCGVIRIAELLC